MNEVQTSVVEEIKTLQAEIEGAGNKVREIGLQALKNATRIGQLLIQKQEELQNCHSDKFVNWLEINCPFGVKTAYRYMDLFKYRLKVNECETLQDSYKRIEEIKQIEHKSEAMKADMRVDECIRTGKKPEGWRRGTDDQLLADKIAYNERVREAERKRDEHIAQEKKEWEEKLAMRKKAQTIFDDMASKILGDAEAVLKESDERDRKMAEWKQKLRLSGDTISHGFSEALLSYLDSLGSDNERLSACHDIIKVVKDVANDLQVKINKSA